MKLRFIVILLLLPFAYAGAQVTNVDPYTGQATTTIPLWTLKSGPLSYPIALFNVSGGIKADAYTGPVGTGWSMSSGFISRTLRGLPDDYASTGTPAKQGWLVNNTAALVGSFTPAADDDLNDCTDEQADYDFLNSLGGFSATTTIRDSEPDIYTINSPGLNGSFTFDNTGQPVFLTKSDYKLSFERDASSGELVKFVIVDQAGNIYTFSFGGRNLKSATAPNNGANLAYFKYNYNLYSSTVVFIQQWKLVSIESANGEKISLTYGAFQPSVDFHGDTFLMLGSTQEDSVYASNYNQVITGSDRNSKQYKMRLTNRGSMQFTKIEGKTEWVEVTCSTVALPVGEYTTLNQPLIGEIAIYSKTNDGSSTLVKKFKFDYETLRDGDLEESPQRYIVLRSVTETGTVIAKPPVEFIYQGVRSTTVSLARNKSRFKDEYGYLNNKLMLNGSTLSPDGVLFKTYVYPALAGPDRLRNKPIAGYVGSQYETPGNSSEDIDYPGLAALNLSQIKLPSGGIQRIYFEPHYYRDGVAQRDYYGGGLRVSSLEFHDGVDPAKDMVTRYSYVEDDGTSSGVLLYRPLRAFTTNVYNDLNSGPLEYYDDFLTQGLSEEAILKKTTIIANGEALNADSDHGPRIGYRKVTISSGNTGKTVYEYDIEVPFGTINAGEWTATKTKIARLNPATETVLTPKPIAPITGYYTYPFAPNPNCDYRNGLLRKVTQYDNSNNPITQTDYSYSIPINPGKIYALRFDQTKCKIGYTRTVGPGDTEPIRRDLVSAMTTFVYSRYEINTNVRPKLLSVTTRLYDQGSSTVFKTETRNLEYGSNYHDLVTREIVTGSDGVEYATNYKYPKDYVVSGAWAQTDSVTKAIVKLKDKNIILPIESWVTKKEGTETPVVVNAALSTFEYDEITDRVYPKKSYTVATRDPFSTFVPSSVNNTGNSSSFSFESTKYNRFVRQQHQDKFGEARSTVAYNKARSSVHTYEQTGVVQLVISNALADQVVYSDFEGVSGYDFSSTGNTPVAGRTAGSALSLAAGSARKLSASLKKGTGSTYIFSCWVKPSIAGTLTIRVADGVHTAVTASISFTTNSAWEYYSKAVSVATLNSAITVDAESSVAVNIDDVLFYPAQALVTSYLYGPGFVKIAETDTRGVSAFYDYDQLGRLLYARDQDRNILKSYSHPFIARFNSSDISVRPKFSSENYVNTPVVMNVYPSYTGAIYKVKIVSQSEHQASPEATNNFSIGDVLSLTSSEFTYTFPNTGTWFINTRITYQGATLTSDNYSTINITVPPITVTICANRPSAVDVCKTVPLISGCVAGVSTGLTMKAAAANGTAPYTYRWSSDLQSTAIGTAQTITIADYAFNRVYTCEVTDATGKVGTANFTMTTFRSDPNCPPLPGEQ